MTDSPGPRTRSEDGIPSVLHVLTLCCIAFALPLLDLLGRTAEFLVIRHIGGGGVFVLLVALILIVPLPIVALVFGSERLMGRKGGRVVGWLVLAGLSALIMLRIASATGLAVVIAVMAGSAVAAAYQRSPAARSFVTFLSPALLVVPLAFILQADVRRAVFSQERAELLEIAGAGHPVFMLVFDELAWHALVDEEGLVDHRRYPNLASLSSESTWYRNAYTVADTTNVAIPAMLTGRFPPDGSLPLLADHPRNLFTLFGGSYRVWADEPITRLCPPSINECLRAPLPAGRRIATLASDLSIAWLHLVLPSPYRERLPSISTTWEGFGGGGTGAVSRAVPKDDGEFFQLAVDELSREGRAERFREMLSAIDPDDDQVLYFTHVLLPHVPWEYLPSGATYATEPGRVPGLVDDLWLDEPEPVRVAEVRYLMQVEMVDLLVGEFVAELRRTGLYDRSLLVLVSDHGTSFRPGDLRRGFSETNAAEILPVPLWIKAPGQTRGDVIDATVTTLDILATMIDILGIDVPWELDGRPTRMLHSERPSDLRVSTKAAGEVVVPLAALEERKYAAAMAVSGAIGHPGDPYRFSRGGPHPDLLGQAVNALPVREGDLWGLLREPALQAADRSHSSVLSSFVDGFVIPDGNDCCDLVLAARGRIVATARTYPIWAGRHAFDAILPDDTLHPAIDGVEIFRVLDPAPGSARMLESIGGRARRSYATTVNGDGTSTLTVDGKRFRVGRELDGWIEGAEVVGDWLRVHGWAVDRKTKGLPAGVAVFYRGAVLAVGPPWEPRDAVVELHGDPAYRFSGFSFLVPASAAPEVAKDGVRAFAFTDDGRASELKVAPVPFEWGDDPDRLPLGDGRIYVVEEGALDGWIEVVRPMDGGGIVIGGWAADLERMQPAEAVLVYHNGRLVKRHGPTHERPDVPAGRCGFGIPFDGVDPDEARRAIAAGHVKFFAIYEDGRASRLRITKDLMRVESPR